VLFCSNNNNRVIRGENFSRARQALVLPVRKMRTIDALLSATVGIFNRETPCKPRKSRQRFSAFPLVAAHECAFEESASTRRSALALRRVTDTGGFLENKVLSSMSSARLLTCVRYIDVAAPCSIKTRNSRENFHKNSEIYNKIKFNICE